MIKNNFSKNQKTFILILVLFFVFIIIYSFATMIYRSGKTKVIISVAPRAATVTMNDTHVGSNTTIWVEPGNYTFKVSYNEHFDTYEQNIDITDETAELYATLGATDDEGREYIKKYREDYNTVEGLISDLENRNGEKIRKANPILNYLPINNSLYSISYTKESDDYIINVKTEAEHIDTVVAKLKTFKDIELQKQNIIFNTENPYHNFQENSEQDVKQFLKNGFHLSNSYIIDDLKQTGNYYYTSIHISDYNRAMDYAHYRVLLTKNEDNTWHLVSTPAPILTTYNTPKVANKILKTINSN